MKFQGLIFGLSLICSMQSFAGNDNLDLIKQNLLNLDGRTGVLTSDVQPQLNGRECLISAKEEFSESSKSTYIAVSMEGTGLYFRPIAFVDNDATLKDQNTLVVSTSSKRPGGDACGDFGGAMGYKKVITLKGNQLTIKESFRCAGDLFRKTELTNTCTF